MHCNIGNKSRNFCSCASIRAISYSLSSTATAFCLLPLKVNFLRRNSNSIFLVISTSFFSPSGNTANNALVLVNSALISAISALVSTMSSAEFSVRTSSYCLRATNVRWSRSAVLIRLSASVGCVIKLNEYGIS